MPAVERSSSGHLASAPIRRRAPPDERDGRAKLICLTRDGRRVVVQALRAVRQIESTYADEVGASGFEEACLTFQELLRRGIDPVDAGEP